MVAWGKLKWLFHELNQRGFKSQILSQFSFQPFRFNDTAMPCNIPYLRLLYVNMGIKPCIGTSVSYMDPHALHMFLFSRGHYED